MNAAQKNEFETQVERASDRELVLRRTFRARPQIVFDAMTKPELIRRWWAPRSLGVELFECDSDPRVGGAYRFVFGRRGEIQGDLPRHAFRLHADLRADARGRRRPHHGDVRGDARGLHAARAARALSLEGSPRWRDRDRHGEGHARDARAARGSRHGALTEDSTTSACQTTSPFLVHFAGPRCHAKGQRDCSVCTAPIAARSHVHASVAAPIF